MSINRKGIEMGEMSGFLISDYDLLIADAKYKSSLFLRLLSRL
ncbi:MAG: hypothetical protein ACTHK0_03630 [Ginsengibacter sp.]